MKKTSGKEKPARSEEEERKRKIEALSLSPECLEDKATTTTHVLSEILEHETGNYRRHWGINE